MNDNFRFTFKLSKTVTHCKGLAFNSGDVELFMEAISPAINKKGCLLVQFPPGLKIDHIEQFAILMEVINDANAQYQWPVAIEFRNDTWSHSEVNHLLNQFNITRVMHDLPGSSTEKSNKQSCCRYLRFHGPEGNYRGSYDEDVLKLYAGKVKSWMKGGQKVFVYFNNTMGDALNNLEMFNSLICAV